MPYAEAYREHIMYTFNGFCNRKPLTGNAGEEAPQTGNRNLLRLAAGLTTNIIANMGKGKHIGMETLTKICETLDCDISDVIQLAREENCTVSTGNN